MAIPRSLLACCAVEILRGPRLLYFALGKYPFTVGTEWSLLYDGKHLYCRNFRGRDFSQELMCKQMGVTNSAGPMGAGGMTKHFLKGNFPPMKSPHVTWREGGGYYVTVIIVCKNRIYCKARRGYVINHVSSLSTGWLWLAFCWWFIDS